MTGKNARKRERRQGAPEPLTGGRAERLIEDKLLNGETVCVCGKTIKPHGARRW